MSHRPTKGQDYTPRFATAPDGGLRLAWTGQVRSGGEVDVFYREWSPASGWNPNIVQLFTTAGNGDTKALEIVTDKNNLTHVVWDDDTGRGETNVTAYYLRGSGPSFTAPQQIFPQYGQAPTRYPYADVGPASGGALKVHIIATALSPAPRITITLNRRRQCRDGCTYCDTHPLHDRGLQRRAGERYLLHLDHRPGPPGRHLRVRRLHLPAHTTITRGQVAKVLVLAFGMPLINPAPAHFTDVPPGSAFYHVRRDRLRQEHHLWLRRRHLPPGQ